jgi:hypothetical protein
MKWEERGLLPVIVQAPFVKNPRSTNAISLGTTQNYEFQAVEI